MNEKDFYDNVEKGSGRSKGGVKSTLDKGLDLDRSRNGIRTIRVAGKGSMYTGI
jgi:hypothetical protein